MYAELVRMNKAGEVDFSGVVSFNLDEYYPIARDNEQSYWYFMQKHLFSGVNVAAENVHVPNGEAAEPQAECEAYDALMAEYGGTDLQVLGIGGNGHIGFNEPAEELELATHLVDLTPETIEANSRFFDSADEVPRQALTMGMGGIFGARKILLLISGEGKAEVAKKLFSGEVSTLVPATLLNLHADVTVILDEAAAKLL
jgi:glucosamine-6-phosphate deaminase